MSAPKRLAARINSFLTAFTLLPMAALCVITFIQVIFRYVLNAPLSWSEEVVRYLLVWITFLGFGLVVYKKSEMSVSFIAELVSKKIRRMMEIPILILILAFIAFFVIEGFIFAFQSLDTVTIALRIPFIWINLSAPIGGVFMFILYLLRLIDYLTEPIASPVDGAPNSSEARS